MSEVVKRGWLDVKKRNLFGSAYKQKFVVLRNNGALHCKTVEIHDTEELEDHGDIIPLGEVWRVQDRVSKSRGRFTFELVVGEEVVLTFACSSGSERKEWLESFHILHQLALPADGSQQATPLLSDFFLVTLVKNRSAQAIGHSGQYLLSIRDDAILLHWRTGAIAHHWPRKTIMKLSIDPEKEGHLLMQTNRIGSFPRMYFEFITDNASAGQVLRLWNICLLGSIPCTPEKLNKISSFLNAPGVKNDKRSVSTRREKKQDDIVQRAGSFSKGLSLGVGGSLARGSGSKPAFSRSREVVSKSWVEPGAPNMPMDDLGVLSQDSFFTQWGGGRFSPPPLPPRPTEESSDEDDPDYAYIDENKVKGPEGQGMNEGEIKRRGSPSIDDQLKELERSIKMENKAKKRAAAANQRRAQTLGRLPSHRPARPPLNPRLSFIPADPEDYLDPVPSKRVQNQPLRPTSTRDVPAHSRSISEPDPFPLPQPSPTKMLSQPAYSMNETGFFSQLRVSPTWEDSPIEISPMRRDFMVENAPTLPPRTWRKESSTSTLSTGSLDSTSGLSIGARSRNSSWNEEESPTFPFRAHLGNRSSASEDMLKNRDSLRNSIIVEEPHDLRIDSPIQLGQEEGTSPLPNGHSSPPPLPPRSPFKERASRQSSASSVSSTSSSTRCPRCRSKKMKYSVGKTSSLNDHSAPQEVEPPQGSLPDLNCTSSVPENSLVHHHHHRHRHSPDSSTEVLPSGSTPSLPSTHNLEYLPIMSGSNDENEQPPSTVDTELTSQMDMLNSFVESLEYLETKVMGAAAVKQQERSPKPSRDPKDQKKSIQTDLDAAMRQTAQVQADLSRPPRRVLSENMSLPSLANGHTPCKRISGTRGNQLLTKHNTISAIPLSSNNNNNSVSSHMNSPLPQQNGLRSPPPPVPPRSLVSLNVAGEIERQTSLRGSQVRSHSLSRQASFGSVLRRPSYHRPNHIDRESSTVFFHHLRDRHVTRL